MGSLLADNLNGLGQTDAPVDTQVIDVHDVGPNRQGHAIIAAEVNKGPIDCFIRTSTASKPFKGLEPLKV
jgi:hypothetical protein